MNNDANNGNGDAGNGGTPPAQNNDTPPAGNTPPAQGNGDSNGDQGATQLTDEQMKLAFQHPRFKELNEKAKLADKLKADQEAAEAKALEEQGKFKELADKNAAEAEKYRTQYETSVKTNAIIVAANKLGAHDANTVAKLVDSGAITLNEDGTVEGVDAAVTALQSTHGYLFKTGSTTKIGGSDTNPQGGANAEFTLSQIKDNKFYTEHQKEIDKAIAEGRVDMTK